MFYRLVISKATWWVTNPFRTVFPWVGQRTFLGKGPENSSRGWWGATGELSQASPLQSRGPGHRILSHSSPTPWQPPEAQDPTCLRWEPRSPSTHTDIHAKTAYTVLAGHTGHLGSRSKVPSRTPLPFSLPHLGCRCSGCVWEWPGRLLSGGGVWGASGHSLPLVCGLARREMGSHPQASSSEKLKM